MKLVESYYPDTIEKLIIFEYANLGSGKKVFNKLNRIGPVDEYQFVMNVIKSKPIDKLINLLEMIICLGLGKSEIENKKATKSMAANDFMDSIL